MHVLSSACCVSYNAGKSLEIVIESSGTQATESEHSCGLALCQSMHVQVYKALARISFACQRLALLKVDVWHERWHH